jgi:hypothetical protein
MSPRVLAAAATTLSAMLLACTPATARTFEKAFVGPETFNGASQFAVYRDLGVRVLETGLSWSSIAASRPADPTNPNDPAYAWPPDLDGTIAQARANGIDMLFIAQSTPAWANGGQADSSWAPTDPQDYANFLIAAAKRYPTVKRWMIWGEPCRAPQFKPITYQPYGRPLTPEQKSEVGRYAVLLDDAYGALKSVNAKNVVIGGNTWTVCDIRPLDWVQNMRLPNGRAPRLDLYGHNPIGLAKRNTPFPPRNHFVGISELPRLQRYVDRYLGRPGGHRIGLWLAEYFLPTMGNRSTNFVVNPSKQGTILAQALRAVRRMPTVTGFGYDFLYDDPNVFGNAGLLTADGHKKSAYFAFKRG